MRPVEESEIDAAQRVVCSRQGTEPFPAPRDRKVGISRNVRDGLQPINGLRHRPEGDTTGWYIWAGLQLSEDPEFFVALHVEHLGDWCPAALPYLQLPPGYRFLIAPGYEDIWFDPSLIES